MLVAEAVLKVESAVVVAAVVLVNDNGTVVFKLSVTALKGGGVHRDKYFIVAMELCCRTFDDL